MGLYMKQESNFVRKKKKACIFSYICRRYCLDFCLKQSIEQLIIVIKGEMRSVCCFVKEHRNSKHVVSNSSSSGVQNSSLPCYMAFSDNVLQTLINHTYSFVQ